MLSIASIVQHDQASRLKAWGNHLTLKAKATLNFCPEGKNQDSRSKDNIWPPGLTLSAS